MTMKLSERALAALTATDLLEQFDGKTHLLFDDFTLAVSDDGPRPTAVLEFRRNGHVVCTMRRSLMRGLDEVCFVGVSGRIPLSVSPA